MMLINPFFDQPGTRGFYCNFDAFPFVDSLGNFTIENNQGVTLHTDIDGEKRAAFNKTAGQNLRFVGPNYFNLQQDLEIEFSINVQEEWKSWEEAHNILQLKGATSSLIIHAQGRAGADLTLTGSITMNDTDNYHYCYIGSGMYVGTDTVVRIIYLAAIGEFKFYVNSTYQGGMTNITQRIDEPRTFILGDETLNSVSAWFNYLKVKVG